MTLSERVEELFSEVKKLQSTGDASEMVAQTRPKKTSVSSNNNENMTNTSFTTDNNLGNFQSNKQCTSHQSRLIGNFERDHDKNLKSPSAISLLRRSQVSPNIFNEKINLNQKRYDHKIAKNNSVDNMGYLSQGYDSNETSVVRDKAFNLRSSTI